MSAFPNRPPVTGYPYPPPPPHPHPTYPYPPPPYPTTYPYSSDPTSLRRATCLRRIFALTIFLIILFGTITFIIWLILRPQLPTFHVTSLTLSNFSISNTSLLTFTSSLTLTCRNPNKKMSLHYDSLRAGIYYKGVLLSETSLPPLEIGTRSERDLSAGFAADGRYLENGSGIGNGKDGDLELNFRMVSVVRFEAKAWRTRRRYLKVFCGGLVVGGMRNGSGSGELVGNTKDCDVGI